MAEGNNYLSEDDMGFGAAPKATGYLSEDDMGFKPKGEGFLGHAQNLGLSLAKGVIAVPEAAVGLADIATGGRAGKFLENADGAVGFRPKQAKEFLSDQHTDGYKAKQQEFQKADGIIDKAGVALSNPSLIANTVVESLPAMGAGGVAARGLMGIGARGVAASAGGVGPVMPGALARMAGADAAPLIAGAVGEGTMMAGGAAEQIRQQTEDGLLTPGQTGAAAATGVIGGAFGYGGAKIASKLGIGDVDTMLAQGATRAAGQASSKSIPRQVVEGAMSEGLLEELPQSVSEQLLQNFALDKPWDDGLDAAIVMGTLAGMGMGGPAAGVSGWSGRGEQQRITQEEIALKQAEIERRVAALPDHQQNAERARLNAQLQAEARMGGLADEEMGAPDMAPGNPSDYRATPEWAKPPEDAAPDYASADDEIFQSTGTPQRVDPVREAVRQAADAGGSLSVAAGVAMDSGAAPTFMPPEPAAATPVEDPFERWAQDIDAAQEPQPEPVVLQNRDRTSAASIAQMQEIAAAPDYMRAGPSREMATGAPVVFGDLPGSAVVGRQEIVVDGRGGRVQAQYAVVDAADVIASNNADGTTVAEYANGLPGKLRAVAGNGRTAGLQAAYQQGTANNYAQELLNDAGALGIDPQAVASMQRPVLVRVMGQSDVTADMGDRTNITSTQKLSPVEQAANDSRRFSVENLSFDEQGNPTAQSIGGFVSSMPVAERGDMLNPDGTPTRQAVDRLMSATFKQAYDSDELVQLHAQATDPDARSVLAAAADASGVMAALRGAGDFDVRGAVTDAVKMAVNASRQGLKLSDVLQNADFDMNPEAYPVATFLAKNIRSPKAMAEGLRRWGQLALQNARTAEENQYQGGLLGPAPTLSRAEIFARIGDAYNPTEQAVAARAQPQAPVAEQASIDAAQPAVQPAAMPVPGNFSGTPSASMGARTDASAGPGFGPRDLKSAIAQIRAQKQQAAQEQPATPTQQGFADGTQADQTQQGSAQPAQTQQADAPGAVARHPTWRKNAIQAGRVARELGLQPQGKSLPQIVAEVDAHDAAQNQEQKPSPLTTMEKIQAMEQDAGMGFKSNDRGLAVIMDATKGVAPEVVAKIRGLVRKYTKKQRDGTVLVDDRLYEQVEEQFAWINWMLKDAVDAAQNQAVAPATQAQEAIENAADSRPENIAVKALKISEWADRETAPIGTWVKADYKLADSQPIYQVRELPLDNLYLPEAMEDGRLQPEKRSYVDGYADRLRAGEAAPGISVIEMKDGRMRVVDGHRRVMAARAAGRGAIRALVSPLIDTPGGKQEATSELLQAAQMPQALTSYTPADIEAQQARQEQAAKTDAASKRAADSQTKADDDRKRIAAASVAAADSFELVQDPMDSLTGQKDVFADAPVSTAPAEPNPLEHTPKQYADAWLRWLAESNNVPLAEVREMEGDAAGLKNIEQRWVDAVVQEARNGKPLPARSIDKLLEVRPSTTLPESAIPDGYQRPEARKAEKEEAAARKSKPANLKEGIAAAQAKRKPQDDKQALQEAMKSAGWAAELDGAENLVWRKKEQSQPYQAQLLYHNKAVMVVTALRGGTHKELATINVSDQSAAADAANKAVADDFAKFGVDVRYKQSKTPALAPRTMLNRGPQAVGGWVVVEDSDGKRHPGFSSEKSAQIAIAKNPDWRQRDAAILPFDYNDGSLTSAYAETRTRYAVVARAETATPAATEQVATEKLADNPPAKRKLPPKLAAKAAEVEALRAAYFAPGNVVASYAGHDRVVAYTPADAQGNWSVTVQAVEKQDGQWVNAPGKRQNTHSTQPDARALKAGPVVVAKPNQPATPADTAQAATEAVAPFESSGIKIAPVKLSGTAGIKWEVHSPEGNSILATREEAIQRAAEDANRAQANAKSRSAAQAANQKKLEAASDRKSEANDIDGFMSNAAQVVRDRAIKTLNTSTSSNGILTTRKALIRERVANGAKVTQAKEGRRLVMPSGTYLAESDITKTAMNYAEHLIAKAQEATETVADKVPVKEDAAGNNGQFDPANPDIRRSFAGQEAVTADAHALASAQQRLDAGEDAETVRQDTGWHKGKDGKWRFEISDADAKLTIGHKGIALGKLINEERHPDAVMPLADLLEHPALFAAYPALADMRVAFIKTNPNGGQRGSFDAANKRIALSDDMAAREALSTLLHEIQHGIQNVEGFATGGSIESARAMQEDAQSSAFSKAQGAWYESRTRWPSSYKALMVQRMMDGQLYEKYDIKTTDEDGRPRKAIVLAVDLRQKISEADKAMRSQAQLAYSDAVESELGGFGSNAFSEFNGLYGAVIKAFEGTSETPAAVYKRLAGEVEARNTQTRQKLTDAERRATAPGKTADVADADVIVVFNGKEMASAPAPANAVASAAQDIAQTAPPPRTPVATIRAAITQAYGKLLGQLEAKGLVTLTQTQEQAIEAAAQARADKGGGDVAQIRRSLATAIQGGTGLDVKRSANGAVQGFFDPQTGQSFLVADNLTADAAPGVLMHEVGIHMAADKTLTPLFNRAKMLLKAQNANPFMQRVQAKMDAAGETSAEEAAAYIVEAYENDRASAPASITKWLADMLATVKAWLHQKGIVGADSLGVADIAAVARANAKSLAQGDAAGGVKFSRAPALDKNIPAFGDIRKPRESVSDVANSLSNATKVLGNRTVPMDSVVGAMSAAADDMARANDLASKLMQPDAFFERVILDDAGNVIEGQHRVTALRILGVKAIPAVVIKDYMRDFDGIAVGDAIRNAQKMGSDQSNQLAGMLAEIYADENGDMAEVVQYEPPRGYEKAWQAGIDELSKGGTGLDVKRSAIGNNGQFDPDNAGIRFSRATVEGVAARMGDAIKSVTATNIKERAGWKLTDWLGMGLQALGRRQLVDIYGDVLPLDQYNKLAAQMEADKNEVGAGADQLATAWGKLKDERQLAELMHEATLAQIDPEKAHVAGDDKARYQMLRGRFAALTPEAKKVYQDARGAYKEHHANVRNAIKERIERSELKGERKAEMLKRMDDEFFKSVKGVYFPLSRFGQYVVAVKGADGKVQSVGRAETKAEAEALRRTMLTAFPQSQGYKVDRVILSKEFIATRDSVGRGFMTELYKVLDKQDMDAAQRAELEDTLGQLYLSALPDLSWAKHGIHRKGTPGFSQDARRAYAQNMFHGARYLAKLRYSDLMQDELAAMQEHTDNWKDVDGFNQNNAQRVVDEFNKRHESLMNPKGNPISTALTSLGFVFYLGLSPASAMVNLSQTALVAYPVMGAKWGFGKASAALLKASEQTLKGKNDITASLTADERLAYDEAVRSGTIDVTMAHDLAGIAQGEDAGVMWKIRPVMKAASWMFHHAERFNRQVTFIAAYRLAREAGADHKSAFADATKATYDGHFDYSSGNRPRIMQGNVARVVTLFKQYGQNMVYTLARNAYQSVQGTEAEKKEARKVFAGLLVSHGMAAGALGLPMVTTLLAAASMLGGDDDEPWDAKVALQNLLADTFGQKTAEVMAHGLSRLTPWDVSGRVGLDRLILPDVQEGLEGQRLGEAAMTAALGPVAGIGVNMLKGLQQISEGQFERGLESMLPTALRGPLKAVRYSNEGVQDKSGISILDEVSTAGTIGQAMGFSPSDARNAQEGKSAVMAHDRALGERRAELLGQFARAAMNKDTDGQKDARAEIAKFNAKHPGRAIKVNHMMASVRGRQKRIDQAQDGVYLPKNRRDAMEAGRFALGD